MTRHASLVSVGLVALVMLASPSLIDRSHAWSAPPSRAKSTGDLSEVLSAYEQVRALLASDKMDGLATAARGLARAARKARRAEIEKALCHWVKAKDLGAARKAFGKPSRPLVALVQADPALKKPACLRMPDGDGGREPVDSAERDDPEPVHGQEHADLRNEEVGEDGQRRTCDRCGHACDAPVARATARSERSPRPGPWQRFTR